MSQGKKERQDFDDFLGKANADRLLYSSLNRVYKGKKNNDDYYFKPLKDGYIADYHILNALNEGMPNGFLLGEYRIKFHPTKKKSVIERNFFSPDEELEVVASKNLGKIVGNDSSLNRKLRVIKAYEGGGIPAIDNPFFRYGFLPISHFIGLRDIKGDNLAYGANDKEIIVFDPMFIGSDREAEYYNKNTIKKTSADEFFIGGMNFLKALKAGKPQLIMSLGSQDVEDPKTISRINAWLKYEQDRLLEYGIIKGLDEFPASFKECKKACRVSMEEVIEISKMEPQEHEYYYDSRRTSKNKKTNTNEEPKKREPVIFEEEYWQNGEDQNIRENQEDSEIIPGKNQENRRIKTEASEPKKPINNESFRIHRRLKTEGNKGANEPKKKALNPEIGDMYFPFEGEFSKKEKPKKKEDICEGIRKTAIGVEPIQTKKIMVRRPNRKLFAVKDFSKIGKN